MKISELMIGLVLISLGTMVSGCFFSKKVVHYMDNTADFKKYEYDKPPYDTVDVQTVMKISLCELEERCRSGMYYLKNDIEALISLSEKKMSNETFLYPLDSLLTTYNVLVSLCNLFTLVHPEKEMRDKAVLMLQLLQDTYVDTVELNKDLYHSMNLFNKVQQKDKKTTDTERYFVQEWLTQAKRTGLALPEKERARIAELKKELLQMATQFEIQLAQDIKKIEVSEADILGMPEECKATFEKNDAGRYVITLNAPSYTLLMNYCAVEETRKKVSELYGQRGYPANKELLESIVRKRNELAKITGFENFARYDLDDQMAKSPERVWIFYEKMIPSVLKKVKNEISLLKQQMPAGVTLHESGVFKPWDLMYVRTHYKEKKYGVDELKIAEYFPLEETLKGLFSLYEAFFGLQMFEIDCPVLWHDDLRMLRIEKNDGAVLGFVILDLHPRDFKYGHAAQCGIINGRMTKEGEITPGLSVVIANFTKPTKDKPALLKYDEVVVFFHEFGHALHSLFGATVLGMQAGTQVKTDFVELPSQLLELWLEERSIVKNISKHYQTKEPIPGALIDNKLASKVDGYGLFLASQILYGMLSLSLHEQQEIEDTDVLWQRFHQKIMRDISFFNPQVHQQCSFTHLPSSYAAKYYGYLWTSVIGCDIFEKIKREGLLNPVAGRAYSKALLVPGGSKDPNEMIFEFLEREPQQDAFLKRYHLE